MNMQSGWNAEDFLDRACERCDNSLTRTRSSELTERNMSKWIKKMFSSWAPNVSAKADWYAEEINYLVHQGFGGYDSYALAYFRKIVRQLNDDVAGGADGK